MTTSSEQDPRIAVAERALPEPTLSPEMLEEMVLHTGDIEGQSHPLVTPETEEQSVQALRKEVDDIEARERSIDDLEAAALFVDPHFAKILSRTLHPAGKAREISQPAREVELKPAPSEAAQNLELRNYAKDAPMFSDQIEDMSRTATFVHKGGKVPKN